MNKAIAIVVAACFLFQVLAHFMLLGYYGLNRTYISNVLCENRNRPQLKCCGRCFLRKQIRKIGSGQEGNGRQAPSKLEKDESLACLMPCLWQDVPNTFIPERHPGYVSIKQQLYSSSWSACIFKPPRKMHGTL